jgi:quercetin dioxygenase-like cupin family protein
MSTAAFIMSPDEVLENDAFRRVLYTGEDQQYVAMALRPGENVGREAHSGTSQTVVVYDGKGFASIEDEDPEPLMQRKAILVEPGTFHDFAAAPKSWLRLLVIYSPPHHPVGLVQLRRPSPEAPAEAEDEAEVAEDEEGDDEVVDDDEEGDEGDEGDEGEAYGGGEVDETPIATRRSPRLASAVVEDGGEDDGEDQYVEDVDEDAPEVEQGDEEDDDNEGAYGSS